MVYPEWFEKYNKYIKVTLVYEPYFIEFLKNGVTISKLPFEVGDSGLTYKCIQLEYTRSKYLIDDINAGIITENHFQIIDDILENDTLREIYELHNK